MTHWNWKRAHIIPKSGGLASKALKLCLICHRPKKSLLQLTDIENPIAVMHQALVLKVAVPAPLPEPLDYLPTRTPDLEPWQVGERVLVPLGKRRVVGILTQIETDCPVGSITLKPIIQRLDRQPALPSSLMALCLWASQYYHHPVGEVLHQALPVLLRKAETTLVDQIDVWRPTQKGMLINLDTLGRAIKQREALTLLREHPKGLHQATLSGMNVKPALLRQLAAKELVELHEQPHHYAEWRDHPVLREPPLTLNDEQQAALDHWQAEAHFATTLLCGVTGSGKTEVYLQAIDHCLRQGKQALVLVPEINLTPQTVNRFKQRFRVPVVSLHSNLTDNERMQAWRQAHQGAAAVIIGTRSALLTPMARPGLLIIDEEHDASYRQQDGFRYSARDLALVRAKLENIPVMLASATPALETLYNAAQGRYQRIDLSQRAGSARPPELKLVDMKKSELRDGLTETARQAIKDCLSAGRQCLVFLNRRGYAPVLMCHDCGWYAECRRCDARMTYHRQAKRLHCHHCDYQSPIPRFCPTCQSTDLRTLGQGTEQLETHLQDQFKKTPVIRIDRDSMRSKTAFHQQLAVIQQGEPCILVGTQMLAKGHHFPHVTLVVIADADAGLFAADFRATEHTAQLIEQVAGRAGRAEHPGTVLIQTHHPDHPMLQTLINGGYLALSDMLLAERRVLQFPPYSYMALLRAEAPRADHARDFLHTLAEQLRNTDTVQQIDLWGPIPTLLSRKAGHHRFQLLLRSSHRNPLHTAINALLDAARQHPEQRRIKWYLEVDPLFLE